MTHILSQELIIYVRTSTSPPLSLEPRLPEGKSLQLVEKGKQNLQIPLLSSQGSSEKDIKCNSLLLGEEKEIILVIKYSDG